IRRMSETNQFGASKSTSLPSENVGILPSTSENAFSKRAFALQTLSRRSSAEFSPTRPGRISQWARTRICFGRGRGMDLVSCLAVQGLSIESVVEQPRAFDWVREGGGTSQDLGRKRSVNRSGNVYVIYQIHGVQ